VTGTKLTNKFIFFLCIIISYLLTTFFKKKCHWNSVGSLFPQDFHPRRILDEIICESPKCFATGGLIDNKLKARRENIFGHQHSLSNKKAGFIWARASGGWDNNIFIGVPLLEYIFIRRRASKYIEKSI